MLHVHASQFPFGGGFRSTFRFRENSEEVGLCRRQRRLFTVLDDSEVSVVVVPTPQPGLSLNSH